MEKSPSPVPGSESKFVSRRADSSTPNGGSRSKKDKRRTPKTPVPSQSSMSGGDGRRSKRDKHEEDSDGEGADRRPVQVRSKATDNYEPPASGRESWWRATIKETPCPGSYETDSFLGALRKRRLTYGFKSDGRKMDPQRFIGKGKYLLPGAYQHDDLQKISSRNMATYGFKNTSRESRDMMLFGKKDKDINVPPNAYDVESYLTIHAEKAPSKQSIFKSGSVRLPSKEFKPKEGPAPGQYVNKNLSNPHPISSSFKSKTPRFQTSHTKVPGPGSYDRMYRPMTETVTKMGRQHGIFFTPQFEVY